MNAAQCSERSAVQCRAVQCSGAVRFIELDEKIKPGLFLTEEIIIVSFLLLV